MYRFHVHVPPIETSFPGRNPFDPTIANRTFMKLTVDEELCHTDLSTLRVAFMFARFPLYDFLRVFHWLMTKGALLCSEKEC